MSERRQVAVGYPFPKIPEKWGQEERTFAQGIHNLFDQIFGKMSLQKIILKIQILKVVGTVLKDTPFPIVQRFR